MLKHTLFAAVVILSNSAIGHCDDLTIFYLSGDVSVIGDNGSNELRIRNIGKYTHEFRGLNGTTINGSSAPLVLPIMDDLSVEMRGGDDSIEIDNLYVNRTSHANVKLDMGTGNDNVELDGARVRKDVTILNSGSKNTDVLVRALEVDAENLYIATEGRSDLRVIHCDCTWLFMAGGLDRAVDLTVMGTNAEMMHIYGSDQADTLTFIMNTITRHHGLIELGYGNDFADVRHNSCHAGAILTIDGGIGHDFWTGTSSGAKRISFELK